MPETIPEPVLNRLSNVYNVLRTLEETGSLRVSSSELGVLVGTSAHTIRKDIHYLGVAGSAGAKYAISDLKELIATRLGFRKSWRSCIVGLGRLGSALLEFFTSRGGDGHTIVAAFDSNVNRLETIRTKTELFPAHRIPYVVREREIDLAIIAVPQRQAQEVADRCCDGGIRGILNFSSTLVKPSAEGVFVRSIDVTGEMRMLSAMVFTRGNN